MFPVIGPLQVLRKARSIIDLPSAYSTDAPCVHFGTPVPPGWRPGMERDHSTTWDLYGAVQSVPASAPDRREAQHLLSFVMPGTRVNTHRNVLHAAAWMTHSQALFCLDRAAEQAKRELLGAFNWGERVVQYQPTPATPHRMYQRR